MLANAAEKAIKALLSVGATRKDIGAVVGGKASAVTRKKKATRKKTKVRR